MSSLVINGGSPMHGTINPSGNKNSVLPILCATILTDHTVTLRNVPDLTDVGKLVEQLKSIGSDIEWKKGEKVLTISNKNIDKELFNGGGSNWYEGFPSSFLSSLI